jgi:triacylglycerol esterase/lipase EstA (alpha/beta hydrolase family)
MVRRMLVATVAVAMVGGIVAAAPHAGAQTWDPDDPAVLPMIFVHGGFGSGQQFEAQALRFTSNGYPADHIEVFEHNSLAWPDSQDEVWARLDQAIAEAQAATGDDQVYLLGHSQGTGVV